MSQNAFVAINPKGIPHKNHAPPGAAWITIQTDDTNRVQACQLQDLTAAVGAGVSAFNTRTGAVVLTEADVSTAQGGVGAPTAAVAGAATLNGYAGAVTSEALVGATTYTLTLTNSAVKAGSIVLVNVIESTGAANPVLHSVTAGAGSVTIVVSMSALTGTLLFNFIVAN